VYGCVPNAVFGMRGEGCRTPGRSFSSMFNLSSSSSPFFSFFFSVNRFPIFAGILVVLIFGSFFSQFAARHLSTFSHSAFLSSSLHVHRSLPGVCWFGRRSTTVWLWRGISTMCASKTTWRSRSEPPSFRPHPQPRLSISLSHLSLSCLYSLLTCANHKHTTSAPVHRQSSWRGRFSPFGCKCSGTTGAFWTIATRSTRPHFWRPNTRLPPGNKRRLFVFSNSKAKAKKNREIFEKKEIIHITFP
jgi:hypothetical protein